MNADASTDRLRACWREDRLALCMGIRQARTPDIAQIVAACGFDALYVDMEHSPVSLETTSALCIAASGAGITPLVRVPALDGGFIGRVLDGGARGVIVPHVERVEHAEAIVRQAKFPPLGKRSVMGAGPPTAYRTMALAETNRVAGDIVVVAMLETPAGIDAAMDIAAVPGLDMLLIGTNDLCTELGVPGQIREPRILDAYRRVGGACKAHDRVLGIGGIRGDLELQRELFALGARFVIAGNDVSYLAAAAREDASRLQAVGRPAQ